MYKKIAIATVIAAPVLANIAANWAPAAAPPVAAPSDVVAPATPVAAPAPAQATAHKPLAYSAIPRADGIDPMPTLDPDAAAQQASDPSSQAAPVAAPAPPPAAAGFGPPVRTASAQPMGGNPIGEITSSEIRRPRY
jgi:hypothetical protein